MNDLSDPAPEIFSTGAFDLLSHPPPTLSITDAEALAHRLYGLGAKAHALTSERDQNFRLEADGSGYVLKISNASETPEVTDFQTGAVMHALEQNPALPLPPFYPTSDGELIGSVDGLSVRLLALLPGVPLKSVDPAPALARPLGELLADLTLALEDYTHPAENHEIFWDLSQFLKLQQFLPDVSDKALKIQLGSCFEDYAASTSALARLPAQVVYNDLNDSNVLVDADDPTRITGLIDFGDLVRAPRLFDVAVGVSYRLNQEAGVVEFLKGYESRFPLSDLERSLLPMLVRCRLATTVLITSWRAAQFPENRDYILRNFPAAKQALLTFAEESLY